MSTIRVATIARASLLLLLLNAWAAGDRAAAQSVRLLHDAGRRPSPAEQSAISTAVDLLCHFEGDVTVAPVQEYVAGSLADYDAVIYLGLRQGADLPESFLADCYDLDRTICWIGANFDQLAHRYSLGRYGFEIGAASPEPAPSRVMYKGMPYWRPELPLPRLSCTRPDVCTTIATLHGDTETRPYVVRSGHLWYFPEMPLDRARKAGTYLILADQMHLVLDQLHEERRTALLVVTAVTPDTDSRKLADLLRQLRGIQVPLGIEVAPFAPGAAPGQSVRLSEKRGLVGVLRGAQREGASIIASVAAEDEENSDRTSESGTAPGEAPSAPRLQHAMVQLLDEMAHCGLYPTACAAPRDAYTAEQASALGEMCSTVLAEHAADGYPPPLPFLFHDRRSGQQVLPDNLPTLTAGRGEVETLLEAARRQAAVSDPWVTVRLTPDVSLQSVTLLITGIRSMEYEFADLRHMTNWTRGDSLHVRTFDSQQLLAKVLPTGWDATVLGPEPGMSRSFEHSDLGENEETLVRPGSILLAYPAEARPHVVFSFEGDPQQITHRAVQRISHVVVLFAIGASVLLLLVYAFHVVQRRSAHQR